MLRLLPAALLIALTGCAQIYRGIAGDSRIPAIKTDAALVLGCKSEIKAEERDPDVEMQFRAKGCGREAACRDTETGWKCFKNPPRLGDFGEGWRERPPQGFASVGDTVATMTGCAAVDTRIVGTGKSTFTASNCGRDFSCDAEWDSVRREMKIVGAHCREDPASAERTALKIAIDRLSVETGCSAEVVKLGGTTSWTRGSERAYRLIACGKPYVCTTAVGRTDCKVALDSTAPTTSP